MALTRITSWKRASQGKAVIVEIDDTKFEISHTDLTTYNTTKKIKTEITRQASLSAKELPDLFFHKNRDGCIAIATGAEPKVWPEDEKDEPGPTK